ncbi:MAG: DUF3552 domain-containing protein, partial [Verrucomicrobia bacterium]|nr:DUF3552 domain-containing protein [Verrucomicrobiota bacterium]
MFLTDNYLLEGVAFLGAGIALGYWLWRWKERTLRAARALEVRSILDAARREAEAIIREAKLAANEESLKIREQTEKNFASRQQEITRQEQSLTERETLFSRQIEGLAQQEKSLSEQRLAVRKRDESLNTEREELARQLQLRREQLQKISHLNEAEARAQLLKEVEQDALQDANDLSHRILEGAKTRAEEQARRVISLAIQRYAGQHTFETTTATINLTGDEIKGRIIGREGRNIRAFEAATGVTVLIDDTPNAVVLSSFDPVRREVAREAMSRLILDGRIHPTRIEEVVSKVS